MNDSDDGDVYIWIDNMVANGLSMIGSGFVMFMYWRSPRLYTFTYKLLAMLCFTIYFGCSISVIQLLL